MQEYCVGITMASDWGDEESRGLDRRLVRRVLGYFMCPQTMSRGRRAHTARPVRVRGAALTTRDKDAR
jgi:hypothetical protein